MQKLILLFVILTNCCYYVSTHPGSKDHDSLGHRPSSFAAQLSETEFQKLMAERFPSYPAHNQPKPKVEDDYEPVGVDLFVPSLNLTVYETGNSALSRVLILIHDIFGPGDKHRQFADIVAAGKNGNAFRVVMPDFFRGGTPGGTWEGGVNQTFTDVLNYYRQQYNGTNSTAPVFGTFGFCWGGGIALRAGQHISELGGFGMIHPGLATTEDARTVQSPALMLPAQNDLDFDEFELIVAQTQGIENVFHRRFTDQRHGFSGNGGNWTNPVIALRTDQVISFTIDFFNKHI